MIKKFIFSVMLGAFLSIAVTASAASNTSGLVSLSLQGVGTGTVTSGNCSGIACATADVCACLVANYKLVGNQGFSGGSLNLELSLDTSVTELTIGGSNESCFPATGIGTIQNKSGKTQVKLNISGLECPTVAAPEVFNATFVITGGSGGNYSSTTGGTGTINGSQVVAGATNGGTSQILLAGSLQPNGPSSFSTPTPTVTGTPTPTPTAVITPTPTGTPTPIVGPTATPTITPTPVPGCTPIYSGTPTGNDAGFTTSQTIPAATTQQGCYQVAFVLTDNAGVPYTGYPAGWTSVYQLGNIEESEIIIHQNGADEPASNVWTTAGTRSEVYEVNISGVCNTSGFDAGIAAYSATADANTMTIGAPPISSSETGANDLTLAFSLMPYNAIVMMSGADLIGFYTSVGSLGGYWYSGVPQGLDISVDNSEPPLFVGVGVAFQAAFAPPSGCSN